MNRSLKNKPELLDNLERVTTRVAKKIKRSDKKDFILAIKDGSNVSIGKYKIINDNGLYSIYQSDTLLHKELYVLDVALAIVGQKTAKKSRCSVSSLLKLEAEYAKNYNELRFFNHVMKDKDPQDSQIYLSRSAIAIDRLDEILEEISRFKIKL